MLYSIHDTIAAIATPRGRGGLGIIRLSGPHAFPIAEKIFKAFPALLGDIPTHTIHHGWIHDGTVPLDEVLLSVMKAPRTYTGEDTIEIMAHGGEVTLGHILKCCTAEGARLAGPGEFTLRAFLNGRMDLAKAEAVGDLINSKTGRAASEALNRLTGAFSEKIELWRGRLLELVAFLEAALDHSEEDITFITPAELRGRLEELQKEIERLERSAEKGRFLREGVTVAIIGRPNTGKSSLLNALVQKERAIVTDIPGTTRDVIEETLDIDGLPVVIMDTAGIRRRTNDAVEKIGQERALECLKKAALIVWLVDNSVSLSDEDAHIAELFRSLGTNGNVIIAANKADLQPRLSKKDISALIPAPFRVVALSARTCEGLEALEQAITDFAGINKLTNDEPILTNARHGEALERTRACISQALSSVDKKETEELTAFHLREALNALGEITGETATDEILGRIFSTFCVGK